MNIDVAGTFVQPLNSQRYANLIAEHGSDAIVVTDCGGLVQWSNPAFTQLSGYSLEEMLGRKPGDVLQGKDTDPETVARISSALKERSPIRTEILNYTKSGAAYWIELNITPIFDENGTHLHFMSIERDVTQRKKLEDQAERVKAAEEARKSERRQLSLANEWLYATKSLDELLVVVRKCLSVMAPEATGALYLYSNSRDVLDLACHWGDGDHAEHMEPDDCWSLRRGRSYTYGLEAIEFPCPHAHDHADHPSICIPILAHGDTIGLLTLMFKNVSLSSTPRDVVAATIEGRRELAIICSEQISLAIANVRLRQQLLDQSVRDQLTGLWNRRWFLDAAHRELKRAEQRRSALSLISIDADRFKRFNDQHGHDAGDVVLRHISAEMKAVFESPLAPCRLGGEEFIVLAPELDEAAAMTIAERFRERVSEQQIIYQGVQLPPTTVSVGIASYPGDGHDVSGLIQAADMALYAAKDGGRNQTRIYREVVREKEAAKAAPAAKRGKGAGKAA